MTAPTIAQFKRALGLAIIAGTLQLAAAHAVEVVEPPPEPGHVHQHHHVGRKARTDGAA